MTPENIATPPQSPPGMNLGRLWRLALKELRETLRDRRTIITLIVMPLLVYPILSIAFRTFLLSSLDQSQEVKFHVATETQAELRTLLILLSQGDKLIQDRESSSSGAPLSGSPLPGADLSAREPAFDPDSYVSLPPGYPESLEDLIRRNDIDLGVRQLPFESLEASPDGASSAGPRFQLVYRPTAPISRLAANFVERRLRAATEHDLRQRLATAGDRQPLRAVWRLKPVADEQGHSFWLGTLVPLVLILMTITGAVYPAIDLTAGERERGTLESLMAAPLPRLAVLIAKYIAVVTVAMLTAVINLVAMMVTVATSGLTTVLFGDKGLAPQSILAVLILLVLFAAFFSAVLLLITSFARSFKEAQAYLIPLMVVSLAPGFMSVMPGLELNAIFSVIPLANIVLLTRDVLEGDAPLVYGAIAVLSTLLYGALALALAARVFGSDAILYGSEGSWSDLFHRPQVPRRQATIPGALTTLAFIAPLYVVLSGLLSLLQGLPLAAQLLAAAGITLTLFLLIPFALARLQGVGLRDGFGLSPPTIVALAAAAILGLTLWPLAYNSIILCQQLGIATISADKLVQQRPALLEYVVKLRGTPAPLVLFALAFCPAVAEELFFRGYLLSALRGRLPAWGVIVVTAVLFGLFHATVGGLLALERILSSTFLGLILGFVAWRTASVLPGIVLHILHNGLMVSLVYFAPQLQAWGWDTSSERYLPLPLVVVTSLLAAGSLAAIACWGARRTAAARSPRLIDASPPREEPVEVGSA